MKSLNELHDYDWFQIPNQPYVLKFNITESGYSILVSNLISVYGEELKATAIKKRFDELNELTDMKYNLIIKNITESLQDLQEGKNKKHEFKVEINQIVISLKFPKKYVNHIYVIQLAVLPVEQVMNFIIAPTIMSALLSMKKVKELETKLQNIVGSTVKASSDIDRILANTEEYVFDPSWLKGKGSSELIVTSFMNLQLYFSTLRKEYCNSFFKKTYRDEKLSCTTELEIKENFALGSLSAPIKFQDEDKTSSKDIQEIDCDSSFKKLSNDIDQLEVAHPPIQVKTVKRTIRKDLECIGNDVPKKVKLLKF